MMTRAWIGILIMMSAAGHLMGQNQSTDVVNANAKKGYQSVSFFNGQYKIDTAIILLNLNLPDLINGLRNASLTKKSKVAEIPPVIKLFLNDLIPNFTMANPNEEWQAGCTSYKNLPQRQLTYLAFGNDYALMADYTGGIAKTGHVLIFKFHAEKVLDFWCSCELQEGRITKRKMLRSLNGNMHKDWGLNTNLIYF